MVELEWQKCNYEWCNFWNLNLADPSFAGLEGLYIIFDSNQKLVYAGHGIIRHRILIHQASFDFIDYPLPLFVTWAKADHYTQMTGSRFLLIRYKPVLNKDLPNPTEGQIYIPLPF